MLSSANMAQGPVRIRRATNGLPSVPLIGVLRIHPSVTLGRSAERTVLYSFASEPRPWTFVVVFFQKVNPCVVPRISGSHNHAVKMPVTILEAVKCRTRRRVCCFCYCQRVGCISENPKSESSREFMSKNEKKTQNRDSSSTRMF